MIMAAKEIEKILARRVVGFYPSKEEAIKKIGTERGLKFYLGIDPTSPEIHLGHTIGLLVLKDLAALGHKVIVLIGDFTARIGDPTGKTAARPPLSEKEVAANMKTYLKQVTKILARGSFKVEYNSRWLSKLRFENVLILAGHSTVQRMLERDMFQERLKQGREIGLHEFLYPLAQGYDSVAMNVDGEVGGADQTFNMLIGRKLMKKYLGKEKLVLATRLLEDPQTGKKMSKSEGNLIAVSDSPNDVFGKVMATIPDQMIKMIFELCTEKDQDWIDERQIEVAGGANPMDFKKELAGELVMMYHGQGEAQKAKDEFEKVFSQKELPANIAEFKITQPGEIVEVMSCSGLAVSKSEARRLIDQGGVTLNDRVVSYWRQEVKPGDVIKVGPRRFLKIV